MRRRYQTQRSQFLPACYKSNVCFLQLQTQRDFFQPQGLPLHPIFRRPPVAFTPQRVLQKRPQYHRPPRSNFPLTMPGISCGERTQSIIATSVIEKSLREHTPDDVCTRPTSPTVSGVRQRPAVVAICPPSDTIVGSASVCSRLDLHSSCPLVMGVVGVG